MVEPALGVRATTSRRDRTRRCEIPLTGVADDSLPGLGNPKGGEQKAIWSPSGTFGNHLDSISKLGLEATVATDYVADGPCHPKVFYPKKFGTGPVYVKTVNGRYNRLCGEGKGPNIIPDYLEFEIALKILKTDSNYIEKDWFFIPKEDMSLPVYHEWRGRIVFSSLEEKTKFIHARKEND